jgi:MOSC domain-containing protein YiiM
VNGGPRVTHVASRPGHSFSKTLQQSITLVAGLGVEGDGHAGATVQHRSRVARDPTQPNLRQVHLMAGEFHDELNAAGFDLGPGDLGENLTTRGIALIDLSAGTKLRLGLEAVVEITGLRNPCIQLDRFRPGLMAACLGRTPEGGVVRKAGVMGVVLVGGQVMPGDPIAVEAPAVFRALERV